MGAVSRPGPVSQSTGGAAALEPVDGAEVTLVVDNFVDLLMAGGEGVHRYLAPAFGDREQLIAEHGFAALLTVDRGGTRSSLLYDAGMTPATLGRNLDVLGVAVKGLRAIVISHGQAGLVIVSGCSHAGAVNVLRNAQRLTGEQRVAGFIGGFHLTGGLFESIIEPTVEAFSRAQVGRVLPAHCTGWKAVHALARAMPAAFVQPAVGTTVNF